MITHPARNLALLAGMSLAFLCLSSQPHAQVPTASERVTQLEQRLAILGERIAKTTQILKDGQAITTYYRVVTETMREYREGITGFENACLSHERRYERMKSEGSPFLMRAWPEIQRCRSDLPTFYREIRILASRLDEIDKDINLIENEVARLKDTAIDLLTEQKLNQNTLRLRRNILSMSDQIEIYKRNY